MIVKNKECHAYFRGKDHQGTCDTDCQWWDGRYLEDDYGCPMWTPREKWVTEFPKDDH